LAQGRAIDQRDAQAALGQMQRDAGADDAGAQDDRIGAGHGFSSPVLYGSPAAEPLSRMRRGFPPMNVFRPFAAALNYVGRHGTLMVAASLFVASGSRTLPPTASRCWDR